MNQMLFAQGTFTSASTAAVHFVDCGFVPDYVKLVNATATADKITEINWMTTMGAAYLKHTVVADTGSTGSKSSEWVASGGITTSNTNVKKPAAWVASTAYAVGDIVHPTTNNGYYYKCSTAGTSHSAEPTWLTVVAGTTSEGSGTVVWTCYNQSDLPVLIAAKKGFTVPAALQVDSAVVHWVAMRSDR